MQMYDSSMDGAEFYGLAIWIEVAS